MSSYYNPCYCCWYATSGSNSSQQNSSQNLLQQRITHDEFVTDHDTVYAIDSTDDIDMSLHFRPDDLCSHFFFTYNEIETIRAALNHSLEYIKEESVKPIYSKEDLQAMKYSAVCFRNLLAKVDRFFKQISPV